jgi:hypothetical protein
MGRRTKPNGIDGAGTYTAPAACVDAKGTWTATKK